MDAFLRAWKTAQVVVVAWVVGVGNTKMGGGFSYDGTSINGGGGGGGVAQRSSLLVDARATLREYPVDLIDWQHDHSHILDRFDG